MVNKLKKNQRKVLMIDDDPKVHQFLETSLDLDYELIHAFSGEEGIQAAKEFLPDLITLDVIMPQMDGWTTLTHLKSDPSLAHIPVIMISIGENKQQGITLSVADYLMKPVEPRVLTTTIQRHIKGKSPEEVTIMLVDDNPDVRGLFTRIVQRAGWKHVEAEDGQQAIDYLTGATQMPTLILLDLMMPVVDGFGVLAALQKNPVWKTIPTIVVSAKDLTTEEKSILATESEALFEKSSYDKKELIATTRDQIIHLINQSASGQE